MLSTESYPPHADDPGSAELALLLIVLGLLRIIPALVADQPYDVGGA